MTYRKHEPLWGKTWNLPLCLILHSAMEYERNEVYLHSFLTSALDPGVFLASHRCHFTPGKRLTMQCGCEAGWEPGAVWTLLVRENSRENWPNWNLHISRSNGGAECGGRQGPVAGCCELIQQPTCCVRDGGFWDGLRKDYFLNKESAWWRCFVGCLVPIRDCWGPN